MTLPARDNPADLGSPPEPHTPFTLSRIPVRDKPERQPDPPQRQRALFSGLDCLPGQLDLFETDGYDERASPTGIGP